MSAQGGCSCGQVRYELASPALFTHACHCLDCQSTTGSAFLINMLVDQRDLRVTGDTAPTSLPTASGAGRDVHACATCGTQLWTRYHVAPANIFHLRAGTLDDTSAIRPAAHVFIRTKQTWLTLPAGAPTFETMYDRNAVWPAESLERFAKIVADS
jgi:hypothetical protein